jgi:hypothetical protein
MRWAMPEEEIDIQKLSAYARTYFAAKKRGEGSQRERFYTLEDRYPTWVYEMVKAVHDDGEWLPDDYKYEYIVDALDLLSEGVDPDDPQLEADVYTSDLLKWFSSSGRRLDLVDEAMQEAFGWEIDEKRGIEGMISAGQWYEKDQVFRRVVDSLQKRLEEIENGEREIFSGRSGDSEGPLEWYPTH